MVKFLAAGGRDAMKRFGLPVVLTVLALAPLLRGQSALEVRRPRASGSRPNGCRGWARA